jgi:hypothetical protein
MLEISKPRKTLLKSFSLDIFILTGKANFTNLSPCSIFSEKTFRRNYSKDGDFPKMVEMMLGFLPEEEKIAAIDCSSVP